MLYPLRYAPRASFRNMIQLMKNQGRLVLESECGNDVVNFDDFVRVFAHFRPPKRNEEKNLMNTLDDKLRCEGEVLNKDLIQ